MRACRFTTLGESCKKTSHLLMCIMHAMLWHRAGLSLHMFILSPAGTGCTLFSYSTSMAGVTLLYRTRPQVFAERNWISILLLLLLLYIFECTRAAYKTSTRDCSP